VIAVGPEAERAGLREMGRCGGKKKRDGWAVWAGWSGFGFVIFLFSFQPFT
jgi:hypothetical protein